MAETRIGSFLTRYPNMPEQNQYIRRSESGKMCVRCLTQTKKAMSVSLIDACMNGGRNDVDIQEIVRTWK